MVAHSVIVVAAMEAAEILSGFSYSGLPCGEIRLIRDATRRNVKGKLQTNTVSAMLHNLIAWRINKNDPSWEFLPKGGATPDLKRGGDEVQVKVTSTKTPMGNKVSKGAGQFILVLYRLEEGDVRIRRIHVGDLLADDWKAGGGNTQFVTLTRDALKKMPCIYSEDGEGSVAESVRVLKTA
jgi:hypothetical protein